MKKEIHVGVLGTGFMCRAHANAYRTIPYMFPDASAVPVLDMVSASVREHAEQAADRYGFARAAEGWKNVLDGGKLDLVDICLPDELHKTAAKEALKKHMSVLCEKPMALNSQDAAELALLAAKEDVVNMVCFNYRFLPAVRMAYEMIQQGVLGSLYHMHVWYYQEGGADPEQFYEDTWYLKSGRTGALQGIGTHAIDQARFLMGEIAELSGQTAVHTEVRKCRTGGMKNVEVEDSARALLHFKNGAFGVLECSCAAQGHRNGLEWEINGSKGSIRFNLEEPNYLEVYLTDSVHPMVSGFTRVNVTLPNHPFMKNWWPAGHNIGWEHGHIHLIQHMLECVNAGKKAGPYGADFTDGFKAAAIVDSIRDSSRTGQRVDMLEIYKKFGVL